MINYFFRRFIFIIIVMFAVLVIIFFGSRYLPGDPIALWVGDHPTQEQIDNARQDLGLDQNMFRQFIEYSKKLLAGDMGISLRTHQPVKEELTRRFFATFELVTASIILAIIIGFPLGLYSATQKGKPIDKIIKGFAYLNISFPIFWLGMILQILFFGKLGWFPLQGRLSNYEDGGFETGIITLNSLLSGNWTVLADGLWHLALPSFTMALGVLGIIIRTTRSAMVDTMGEPYFNTFLSFGLSTEKTVYLTGYKNTLVSVTTVVGLSYGLLLGGTFLIESIFDWPGIGNYGVLSILTNDYPSIIGVTLLYASCFVLINFIIDIIYVLIDPRIRK